MRLDCERYGVTEYYRFDPSGGGGSTTTLRWFDPKTETYLRTFTKEVERAERTEVERDREAAARRQAEVGNRRLQERLEALGDAE